MLLRADWRGAHLWLAAGLSGDAALVDDLVADDPYAPAITAFAPDLGDRDHARRVAKQCLLMTLNGAGSRSIASTLVSAGLVVDEREAHRRRQVALDRYPVLARWLRVEREPDQPRSWATPLGRIASMPADSAPHARVGSVVQSWEADALRLVLQRYSGRIVLTAHDEVLAEEPVEVAAERVSELREVMDEAMLEVARLGWLRRRYPHATTCELDVRLSWGEHGAESVVAEVVA